MAPTLAVLGLFFQNIKSQIQLFIHTIFISQQIISMSSTIESESIARQSEIVNQQSEYKRSD